MGGPWLFHGNLHTWRVLDYVKDHPEDDFSDWTWTVVRYRNEIRPGDRAALWIAGPPAVRGVHAIGRVTSEPFESIGDGPYWEDAAERDRPRLVAGLAFEHVLFGDPLLATDLRQDPRFAGASILRIPRGANPHRLREPEWRSILDHLP
jgi:hypothetical protein